MRNREYLLNSKKMAEFAGVGFIRADKIVPADLCAEAVKQMSENPYHNWQELNGVPLDEYWSEDDVFGRIFRLPQVRGIIESLVGPNPRYDHHFPHRVSANSHKGSNLHQDSEIDTRTQAIDIQVSFFGEDTPAEMGGTLFVPGSQFRQVHESQIGRYQNIVGQVQAVCEAGTMFFWHHNVWHSARSNHTDRDRFMFKLRLNPTVRQLRLWNTDDLDDPEVLKILMQHVKWHGQESRIEQIQRIKFWRYLTGNETFDHAYYMTRLENNPKVYYVDQA